MMHGQIHATSTLNKGSNFFFNVIVEDCLEHTLPLVQADRKGAAGRAEPQNGPRLLIVEDNIISQNLAREILGKSGYQVSVADNGKMALNILQADRFEAILMDLRMPVMDGIQTIREIRANPDLREVPVIAISAGVLDEEIKTALGEGFDHYITKPVNFDSLIDLLCEITQQPGKQITTPTQLMKIQPIRGIDFSQALKTHDHDQELLTQLVGEFVRIYSQADEELSSLVEDNNMDEAERLAHNIAGVAGGFGANQLMHSARSIEQVLIRGERPEPADLSGFNHELKNFVLAIEQYQVQS